MGTPELIRLDKTVIFVLTLSPFISVSRSLNMSQSSSSISSNSTSPSVSLMAANCFWQKLFSWSELFIFRQTLPTWEKFSQVGNICLKIQYSLDIFIFSNLKLSLKMVLFLLKNLKRNTSCDNQLATYTWSDPQIRIGYNKLACINWYF